MNKILITFAALAATACAQTSEYSYTLNSDLARFMSVEEAPHGGVFYLSGVPSGVNPADSSSPAFVVFEIGKTAVSADVVESDTILLVATKLQRAFREHGIACTIYDGGAILVCESPDGLQPEGFGSYSMDTGLSLGFDWIKF